MIKSSTTAVQVNLAVGCFLIFSGSGQNKRDDDAKEAQNHKNNFVIPNNITSKLSS